MADTAWRLAAQKDGERVRKQQAMLAAITKDVDQAAEEVDAIACGRKRAEPLTYVAASERLMRELLRLDAMVDLPTWLANERKAQVDRLQRLLKRVDDLSKVAAGNQQPTLAPTAVSNAPPVYDLEEALGLKPARGSAVASGSSAPPPNPFLAEEGFSDPPFRAEPAPDAQGPSPSIHDDPSALFSDPSAAAASAPPAGAAPAAAGASSLPRPPASEAGGSGGEGTGAADASGSEKKTPEKEGRRVRFEEGTKEGDSERKAGAVRRVARGKPVQQPVIPPEKNEVLMFSTFPATAVLRQPPPPVRPLAPRLRHQQMLMEQQRRKEEEEKKRQEAEKQQAEKKQEGQPSGDQKKGNEEEVGVFSTFPATAVLRQPPPPVRPLAPRLRHQQMLMEQQRRKEEEEKKRQEAEKQQAEKKQEGQPLGDQKKGNEEEGAVGGKTQSAVAAGVKSSRSKKSWMKAPAASAELSTFPLAAVMRSRPSNAAIAAVANV
eukprot:TRINITY_DN13773_c0_g1_i1.p1 TRINITY_DN13773_c0_g1~~TRINITY_DN13773_c0_g1_i1.p1  ORF type:complete len:490 (+),score=54.08 TRINITY_DN13773_c0_g1_i1:169-1638(+)